MVCKTCETCPARRSTGRSLACANRRVTLGYKTAAERVASFLLFVARNVVPEREESIADFEIPLGRSEIADFLGLTVETVSRQLTHLRKAGVIGIERNRELTILDPPALEASSGA